MSTLVNHFKVEIRSARGVQHLLTLKQDITFAVLEHEELAELDAAIAARVEQLREE